MFGRAWAPLWMKLFLKVNQDNSPAFGLNTQFLPVPGATIFRCTSRFPPGQEEAAQKIVADIAAVHMKKEDSQ